ncbi:MAG: RluA family pseudouridine synthase [Clostridia bacterium]|nr:RluA family pseudouridine synthase [Clostridia bacterium]
MDIFIDSSKDGLTVLEYIKKHTAISSAHLKHLKFSERGILVNGSHVTVRYTLRNGDILSLATEDSQKDAQHIEPCDLPLEIIYEDGDCAVPSKPANMPTHPSHGHYGDTVANALAFRYAHTGEPFVFRPVNRLDRNTSGLLLIAKNRIAAGELSRAMTEGRIKKVYIALLDGELPSSEGSIETYMRRTAESIIVRENCPADGGGDYALTKYRTIKVKNRHTLVAASPVTGRTHQLRVHFAGLGAPITGDDMYGSASELIDRHALHSAALSFPRVSDGERVVTRSPLPEDMAKAVSEVFGELDTEAMLHMCEQFLLENDKIN